VEWKTYEMHLGNNKEIYNAKLFTIAEALKLMNHQLIGNKQTNTIQIFTNFSSALIRMQNTNPGLGQWITKRTVEGEQILRHIRWIIE
jgi:hypothetical protein